MTRIKITKYSINQTVWYMEDNKVKSSQVAGIYITIDEKMKGHTLYSVKHFQSIPTTSWLPESKVFKQKSTLLNSL